VEHPVHLPVRGPVLRIFGIARHPGRPLVGAGPRIVAVTLVGIVVYAVGGVDVVGQGGLLVVRARAGGTGNGQHESGGQGQSRAVADKGHQRAPIRLSRPWPAASGSRGRWSCQDRSAGEWTALLTSASKKPANVSRGRLR